MKTIKFLDQYGTGTVITSDFTPQVGERIVLNNQTYDVIQYTTDFDNQMIIIQTHKLTITNG